MAQVKSVNEVFLVIGYRNGRRKIIPLNNQFGVSKTGHDIQRLYSPLGSKPFGFTGYLIQKK